MKRHIYIFRHGQSFFNRQHRFTGWKDSKLTEQGIKDAKKVGKKLKDVKIDVAFQTSLSRSKDTLKYVLGKNHPECKKIITDDRMLERNYGDLQGHHHSQFVENSGVEDYKTLLHWHKIDVLHGKERQKFIEAMGEAELQIVRRSYEVAPPHGESVKIVEQRVLPFVKDLIKMVKQNKVNVAISAHGNSMRPFRRYFEKLSIEEMMHLENPWDDYFHYAIEVGKKK